MLVAVHHSKDQFNVFDLNLITKVKNYKGTISASLVNRYTVVTKDFLKDYKTKEEAALEWNQNVDKTLTIISMLFKN